MKKISIIIFLMLLFVFSKAISATSLPSPAKDLRVIEQNNNLSVQWNDPDDGSAARYKIYKSEIEGETGSLLYSSTNNCSQSSGCWYTDVNIEANKDYFYIVISINENGEESVSNIQVSGIKIISEGELPDLRPFYVGYVLDETGADNDIVSLVVKIYNGGKVSVIDSFYVSVKVDDENIGFVLIDDEIKSFSAYEINDFEYLIDKGEEVVLEVEVGSDIFFEDISNFEKNNLISESDEENNEYSKSLKVNIIDKPDLIINDIYINGYLGDNKEYKLNEKIKISTSYLNQGSDEAIKSKIGFYLNNNLLEQIDTHDIVGLFGSAIDPNWSSSIETTLTNLGDNIITVTIDDENIVDEEDEDNNSKTINIKVAEDILLISDVQSADITSNTARINYKTNRPTHFSHVWYGLEDTVNGRNKDASSGMIFKTEYSMSLINLNPDTKYYFIIIVEDEDGNKVESNSYNFTTEQINSNLSTVNSDIIIYNPRGVINKNTAKLYWETNNLYTCSVTYSGNINLQEIEIIRGRNISIPNSFDNKYHYDADLENLEVGIDYYYKIVCSIVNETEYSETQIQKLLSNNIVANINTQVSTISITANQLYENRFDEILSELKQLRDTVREQNSKIKYLEKLTQGVKKLAAQMEEAINNFITYGVDSNTQKLGEGERAAVMYSYKNAFNKLPETEEELTDAIKIANGRWPGITNQDAEKRAKEQFQKIYKRIADMNDASDNAAVTVMAYGLRQKAENRNLSSEKNGINTFKNIYGYHPSTTEDWNIMQAITYSGATRGVDSDGDLLTDEREVELGTDLNNKDSDGDGYLDGIEVANGYNPLKK